MPPIAIAAGIAAGGSIIGGAIASGGAKKVAQTQADASNQQIAANNQNRDFVTGLSQPTIDRGNAAASTYSGILGLGDANASRAALDTWRGSVGYQDLLNTGLGAVTANAYARGAGDSGATAKRLQERGMNIANQNQGVYMSNLNNLIQTGNSAIGNVAGVATQTTAANNAAIGSAADASGNASIAQGAIWNSTLQNLANAGSAALGNGGSKLGSSYALPNVPNGPAMTGYGGGVIPIGANLPSGFINFRTMH